VSAPGTVTVARLPLTAAERQQLRGEIEEFNCDYAEALDSGNLDAWPKFFTDDAFYRVRSREDAEAGLPVGLVYCEGRAMIQDRAEALLHTAMYEPRYYRHMISNIRVQDVLSSGEITARANYLLLETNLDQDTRILQSGRYFDEFRRVGGHLLLHSRDCVYDSLIVQTAIVTPV
jgi:anthranilate 1,2-dioxygenase small subunit